MLKEDTVTEAMSQSYIGGSRIDLKASSNAQSRLVSTRDLNSNCSNVLRKTNYSNLKSGVISIKNK